MDGYKTLPPHQKPNRQHKKQNNMKKETTKPKTFFGKLKSFEGIITSEGYRKLLLLDYKDKYDLANQIKEGINFLCHHSTHWIEIEINNNGFWYSSAKGFESLIIHEDFLSEKRFL